MHRTSLGLRALALAGALSCALVASLAPARATDATLVGAQNDTGKTLYNLRAFQVGTVDGNGRYTYAPGHVAVDASGVERFTATNPGSVVLPSGQVVVLGAGSAAIGTVGVTALPALPAGANAIGSVSVSNFPATQPVSASALPLPTGAATAAKQPALGTAGTPSADVLTVQGAASMTALKVDGSGVTQPVSLASVPAHAVTNAGTFAVQPTAIDGADATQGAKADAAYTGSGSASVVSLLKGLYASSAGPIPAGSAAIGSVLIANSGGVLTSIVQADASAPINVATAASTQLVALSAGKRILVTSYDVVAAGTTNVTMQYGTGTNCGTGTTVLTGAYNLTAQAGVSKGGGLGPVLVVPAGNALCVLTSAAVQVSGAVSYTQF